MRRGSLRSGSFISRGVGTDVGFFAWKEPPQRKFEQHQWVQVGWERSSFRNPQRKIDVPSVENVHMYTVKGSVLGALDAVTAACRSRGVEFLSGSALAVSALVTLPRLPSTNVRKIQKYK